MSRNSQYYVKSIQKGPRQKSTLFDFGVKRNQPRGTDAHDAAEEHTPAENAERQISDPAPSSSETDHEEIAEGQTPAEHAERQTSDPPPAENAARQTSDPPPAENAARQTSDPPPAENAARQTSDPPPAENAARQTSDPPPAENAARQTSDPPPAENAARQTSDPPPAENAARQTSDPPPAENAARQTSDPPPAENAARQTSDPPPAENAARPMDVDLASEDTAPIVIDDGDKAITGSSPVPPPLETVRGLKSARVRHKSSPVPPSVGTIRGPNTKYELTYPWAYHSENKKGYICKYCELFADGHTEKVFSQVGAVLGEHPTRKLKIHATSQRHKISVERYTAMNCGQLGPLRKLIDPSRTKIKKANRHYLKKVMRMTRFLVVKKWGYAENVRDLAQLFADMGDEQVARFLTKDVNYLSSTSVTEIVECMSTYLKRKVMADIKGKPFTLLLDESVDNAHRSQVSIMARWVGEDGVTKEQFIDMVSLSGTKATDFIAAVEAFCHSFELEPSNIRFVALDGCNTMSGEKTGLQRRIRHLAPHSIYINCRNHKLALCFVHLVRNHVHLQDVEGLLISIWKLFNFSAKRHGVFMNMQEVYGERPLSFVRASGTRWLSHLRASVRFVDRYEALLDTLDTLIVDTRDPELDGIRAKTTDCKIVFTILLLTDVLTPVNYLSLYLQEDTGFFTCLSERVKACIQDLHRIIDCYRSREFQDLQFRRVHGLIEIIQGRTDLQRRLRDQVANAMSPEDYLDTIGIPLVHNLIAEIEDGFSVKSPVLAAFGVLDPCNLPHDAVDIPEYGKEKIGSLARHYCFEQKDTFQGHVTVADPVVDPVLEEELLNFRTHLFVMKTNGVMNIPGVLQRFEQDKALRMCFPNVQQLYNMCSLIPQSTAVVERSFSLMNDVCTMLRTSLGTGRLASIMRIASNTSPSDEDYEGMINVFNEKKRVLDL